MGSRFETSLKPSKAKWVGGYKAGAIDPSKIADEVMGQVDGPWLTCYMLRRFGWPNFGSDGYKELCSWSLVTPLPGLWMTVTPFLGGGSNLHFGVLFDAETGRELERDPGRESFWRRRERAQPLRGCPAQDGALPGHGRAAGVRGQGGRVLLLRGRRAHVLRPLAANCTTIASSPESDETDRATADWQAQAYLAAARILFAAKQVARYEAEQHTAQREAAYKAGQS